jgi:hypothetical protein
MMIIWCVIVSDFDFFPQIILKQMIYQGEYVDE